MSIDTPGKRMSAMNPGCPWRGPMVDAAGAGFSVGDRMAAVFLYGGIPAGQVVVVVDVSVFGSIEEPFVFASVEEPSATMGLTMATVTHLDPHTYPWYPGEDRTIGVTVSDATDITGWTIHFRMANTPDGASLLTLTVAQTGLKTFTGSIAGSGTKTLPRRRYCFEARRVDSGFNRVLGYITWPLLEPAVVPE